MESISAKQSKPLFKNLPLWVLAPLPLPLLQPLLHRIVARTAIRRPGLFNRLGKHKNKIFLIDPLNFPFVFFLSPNPECPQLRAYRRSRAPTYDARIAGTFLTLLDMIDGHLDGDALFFSRDLVLEGDTEAIVVLRNALDDMEGSIADDIAESFGAPAHLMLSALRGIRNNENDKAYAA